MYYRYSVSKFTDTHIVTLSSMVESHKIILNEGSQTGHIIMYVYHILCDVCILYDSIYARNQNK